MRRKHGTNKTPTAQWAKYIKEYREEKVDDGLCGWCFKPRTNYKWLCDECAAKHRERQRVDRRIDMGTRADHE